MTNLFLAYSNAVLAVVLPEVCEFAGKLDLPEQRCSVAEVRNFNLLDQNNGAGFFHKRECVFRFKNGNIYRFLNGFVQSFESGHAFYDLQDPKLIEKFYGPLNMTREDAIALARKTIRDLGYNEEALYADLEPEVRPPPHFGTNIVPHYLVEWPTPNHSSAGTSFEINGSTKKIESVSFSNRSLDRTPPVIPGFPAHQKADPLELPVEQSRTLMQSALPEIEEFTRTLNIPTVTKLDAEAVQSFKFHIGPEGLVGTIRFYDGRVFCVQSNKVIVFRAPDSFSKSETPVRVKDFVGRWKISEPEAISIARATLKKLGVSARAVDAKPEITLPAGGAKELIPRYELEWVPEDGKSPVLQVEIDGENGAVKSLLVW